MFFFVNQYLLSSNSSVEHAEIKRLKLFAKNGVAAKLVTRDFSPVLHHTLPRFGLKDSQLVNMYDFFAGGTVGEVSRVDWYDPAGNLTLRERYDLRGYKAVDEFFGQDGQLYFERYYRPDGTIYLERYYVQSVQNTPINSLNVLRGYEGKDHYFDSLDDLFVFFLNELNRTTEETNTFIADRPAMAIQPVLQVAGKARKYLWLPINHVDDGQNLLNGPVNGMLQGPFTSELKKWDGIIVMTEQQAHNLRNRLGKHAPVMAINGTPVSQPTDRITMAGRTSGQLVYVGRLGEDKQISQLLTMLNATRTRSSRPALKIGSLLLATRLTCSQPMTRPSSLSMPVALMPSPWRWGKPSVMECRWSAMITCTARPAWSRQGSTAN